MGGPVAYGARRYIGSGKLTDGLRPPSSIRQILGTDLLGLFDAEDLSSIVMSGSSVSSWTDKVNNYSVTQATTTAQPQYSATGFNGRPCVTFDGVDDFLSAGTSPYPSGANESEIWILGEQLNAASVTTLTVMFGYGTTNASAGRFVGRIGVSGFNRARTTSGDGTTNVLATAANSDLTGRFLHRSQYRTDGLTNEVNGLVDPFVTASLGGTLNTRTRIGASLATTAASFANFRANKILICKPLPAYKAGLLRRLLATQGGVALAIPFSETPNPSLWAAQTATPIEYNGTTHHNHSAMTDHSLMLSTIHPNFIRSEIRAGEYWSGDEGKASAYNRAEMGAWKSLGYHHYGVDRWFSFAVKGRNLLSGGAVVFQILSDDVELQMVISAAGTYIDTCGYNTGSRVRTRRYTGAAQAENTPENYVIRALPIPVSGQLQVWRGGVEVLNLTGIDFGMGNVQRYHKYGAYRVETNSTFVTEHANVRFGDDLSAKIASPDPWPSLWS